MKYCNCMTYTGHVGVGCSVRGYNVFSTLVRRRKKEEPPSLIHMRHVPPRVFSELQ